MGSFTQDMTTDVPEPFDLKDWIKAHQEELDAGAALNLFDGHPDKEFNVRIVGGGSTQSETFEHETFFYQLKGEVVVEVDGRTEPVVVPEDGCCGRQWRAIHRSPTSWLARNGGQARPRWEQTGLIT